MHGTGLSHAAFLAFTRVRRNSLHFLCRAYHSSMSGLTGIEATENSPALSKVSKPTVTTSSMAAMRF